MIGFINKIKSSRAFRRVEKQLTQRNDVAGDQSLFFIVSAGRSGSTLLRKHLVSNSDVAIPPESEDFIPTMAKIWLSDKSYESKVSEAIDRFYKKEFFSFWELDFNQLQAELLNFSEDKRTLANVVYRFYQQEAPNAVHLGDKTPYLVYYLDWLQAIFPKAKFIYLIRDGRAVVSSYIHSRGYKATQASLRWKGSITSFERSKIYAKNQYYLLRYEDFVISPTHYLKEVCNYLEISFESKMVEASNSDLGDTHLSHHQNIKNAISTASIDKWKNQLSFEEITEIERHIKKQLKQFSYPLHRE